MAGIKITDLAILTSPQSDDLLYIVDVSDTSQSPQGTSKQIEVGNLIPTPTIDVQSVTGEWVDNTDPQNPVINRPYAIFVGKLSQSGTADPYIAHEFENTIPLPSPYILSIQRLSTGYYNIDVTNLGLSVGYFSESRTFVLATPGSSTYNDCFVVIQQITSLGIFFYNYGNGGGLQDDFTNMNIEIRVY